MYDSERYGGNVIKHSPDEIQKSTSEKSFHNSYISNKNKGSMNLYSIKKYK